MKKLAIALALVATVSAAPKKAQAFGLVNILATGSLDYVGAPQTFGDLALTTLCLVFLPVCLLDETAPANVSGFSQQDLLDNGYSLAEIASLQQGQVAFTGWLKAENKALVRDGNMPKEELVSLMSSIEGMTPEYIGFVLEN